MRSSPEPFDDGQVMLLIVFFGLILMALLTVVVDVSTVFLAERELQSTADGAALAAAQQVDLAGVYAGQSNSGPLPLSASGVGSTVATYASVAARIPHECSKASYVVTRADVEADGETVTVQLTCRVPLPFVNVVARLWSNGVTVSQTAHAHTAISPLG